LSSGIHEIGLRWLGKLRGLGKDWLPVGCKDCRVVGIGRCGCVRLLVEERSEAILDSWR